MKASLGIFVGGKSSRMGGFPKGLIQYEGERLVERMVRVAHEAELDPLLIGAADEYAGIVPDVPRIEDAPQGIGPLGGLGGLLAEGRGSGRSCMIAVACDMPAVSAAVLHAILALEAVAPVLAAQRDGRWEPFLARYSRNVTSAFEAFVAAGGRSFQRLFAAHAAPLTIDPAILSDRVLCDWDAPADLPPEATLERPTK